MTPRAPAAHSARVLVRLDASSVGLFRFLLEAWDNLAGFTVLDREEALLQVFFSPHQESLLHRVLTIIGTEIPLTIMPWPVGAAKDNGEKFSRKTVKKCQHAVFFLEKQADERGQSAPEQTGAADVAEQRMQAG